MSARHFSAHQHTHHNAHKSKWAGALIGIGAMAAVDEIIFHQILAWHHFYDGSTPAIGLLTDGLLHAAELIVLVAGFFMLLELRGGRELWTRAGWAGFFMGAGGFQLFDGLINHKLLRLHQIRYGVDNLMTYDLVWFISGAILLLIGLGLGPRKRQSEPARS